MIEIREVLRQWLLAFPKSAIARAVGADRKTVRRYIKVAMKLGLSVDQGVAALTDDVVQRIVERLKQPKEVEHGAGWTRCQEHKDFIKKHVEGKVVLTKVRKLLARKGVMVSYPTLRRFARAELGFSDRKQIMPMADCAPGQEVQLDTGWMICMEPDETGRRRRFRAWIFTSVCTRYRFVYPTLTETTQDAIEACEAAWRFFGGVFHVIIPDNTKAIISKADPLEPRVVLAFLEYAQSRGFVVDPARARRPTDKARVERSVQDVRNDGFGGETIVSITQARELIRFWCVEEYGTRIHSTTQRRPLEYFEAEERAQLLPAPTDTYYVPHWCEPKVAPDQHAAVLKALYSLPYKFVGRRLWARADATTVRFYQGTTMVKVHPKKSPGGRSTDDADFPPERLAAAKRDLAYLVRQAAEHGEAVAQYASKLLDVKLPWTRMRRVYRLLSLCKRYGDARVSEACKAALPVDMVDVKRLENMLLLAQPQPAPELPRNVIPLSRYLRPASTYAIQRAVQPRDSNDQGGSKP